MKKITIPMLVVVAIAAGTMLLPAPNSYAGTSVSSTLKVCRVIVSGGTDATVVATGKSVFLATGTSLNRLPGPMRQGYIAVKAKIGRKIVTLSIMVEDTNCDD